MTPRSTVCVLVEDLVVGDRLVFDGPTVQHSEVRAADRLADGSVLVSCTLCAPVRWHRGDLVRVLEPRP